MELTICMSNAAQETTVLPHAYQHLIQGMLFDIWKEDPEFATQLHVTDNEGKRIFRGFTFGALQGRYVSKEKHIAYTTPLSLSVRALNPVLIDKLVQGIQKRKQLHLGSNCMEVTSTHVSSRHIESNQIHVQMLTPITVYHTNDRNRTEFFRPDEKMFYDGIIRNAARKFLYFFGTEYSEPFSITPLFREPPKRMFTVYKGSYIIGWYGQYALSSSPKMLDMLYQVGIGGKNSQGFGMFEVNPAR